MTKRELLELVEHLQYEEQQGIERIADLMEQNSQLKKAIRKFQKAKVSDSPGGVTLIEVRVKVPPNAVYSRKDCIADALAQIVRIIKRKLHVDLDQDDVNGIIAQ